jgi:uncharacterized delta-60 repeat protein
VSSIAAVAAVALIVWPAAASGEHLSRSVAAPPLAGSLDSSFGNGGIVSLGSSAGGIAVQSDGKIVVAGESPSGGLLARYLPNGSLDPSFGDGGSVQTPVEHWSYGSALGVAVQPDGKIVVAGSSPVPVEEDESNFSVFTLARYNPNGSLDTSFGTEGITKTAIPEPAPFAGTEAGVRSLAILADGEILAAGGATWDDGEGMPSNFVLAKYTATGSLDPTFGEGGIVQTRFYGDDSLQGIVVQPDGKIVASGTGGLGGHGEDIQTIALARYEADGSLDPTFGTDGRVTTDPGLRYDGGPSALLGQKIVVAGETEHSAFLVLGRYQTSGRPDSSFGKHGFVEIKRVTGLPTAVLAQNDGKILVAIFGDSDRVVRFLPSGRLDTSFGTHGIVSLGAGSHSFLAASYALAVQTDGKVVAGGGGGDEATLARLMGGNNCVVPALRGEKLAKARAALTNSYCRTGHISKRFSNRITRGRVISTVALVGDRRPAGTKIDLVVSQGKPTHRS